MLRNRTFKTAVRSPRGLIAYYVTHTGSKNQVWHDDYFMGTKGKRAGRRRKNRLSKEENWFSPDPKAYVR